MCSQHKTAILIFANTGEKEAHRKSIANANVLFGQLNAFTIETVKKTKVPYFHFSETKQKGTSFGERFTNAMQAVFDKGYQNVIAIGNDTPQLRAADILAAKQKCESGNLVLGPSMDGGFYLIAIDKNKFNAIPLDTIMWQTTKVLSQILGLSTLNNIDVEFLSIYSDIDSVSDIKYYINSQHISEKLLALFLAILTSQLKIETDFEVSYSMLFQNLHFTRGSPYPFIS